MDGKMIQALHIEGLSLARGDRTLFAGLSFSLPAGAAAALTGANGAGKTTLLRAIAGFVRPAAGTVRLEGAGEIDLDEARGRDMHLLGHQDGLKSGRLAREELAFQAAWAGAPATAAAAAAAALDLDRLLGLEVRRLSAGQRRRLALARLVAAPRSLWLLDEPLSPLDARYRARVGELMAEHLAGGGMILAAVHDPLPIPAQAVGIAA
jgi:heme exporter protein A